MINNLDELERTTERNVPLSFEEYIAIREPAVNIVINDYAHRMIEAEKEKGESTLTFEEAKEIAKKEIPAGFVPEWMKNLRVSANIAGTELCYLEALKGTLDRIEELLHIVFEEKIEEHLTKLAESFRREENNNAE